VEEKMMNLIIMSGIFGKTKNKKIDEFLAWHIRDDSNQNVKKTFWTKLFIMFPKKERLHEKYNFAKKYPVLLPIAWIHRAILAYFKNDIFKEILLGKINTETISDKQEVMNHLKQDIKKAS
jgi:hypothetical protein